MNPLAKSLNEELKEKSPHVYSLLSNRGRELYFPKGIISQSQEAKEKAYHLNATIGMSLEKNRPMHLSSIDQYIQELDSHDIYPYAPTQGEPDLRKKWKEKLIHQNLRLQESQISLPIVTSGITHGLSIVADLFLEESDSILIPEPFWGNYRLLFEVQYQAKIQNYSLFDEKFKLNLTGFQSAVQNLSKNWKQKSILLFNFPHNPTGYTPSKKEAFNLKEILQNAVESHPEKPWLFIFDESYFGFFYEEEILRESFFSLFSELGDNVLCIKLDGATKEYFAWGFRVGFLTFGGNANGNKNGTNQFFAPLEKKIMGSIRSRISSSCKLSQSLILKAMNDPSLEEDWQKHYQTLKSRVQKLQIITKDSKYKKFCSFYPFNSGYFFCIRLKKGISAMQFRELLLQKYGIGVIALDEKNIRIAFSCLDEENIPEFFDIFYKAFCELQSSS